MRIPNFDLDEEKTLTLIERLGLADALNASRQEKDEEEAKDGTQPLAFKLVDGGENLSGGQQQRIGLLRSLQVQRPVMILDEATSDLDAASRDAVFDILQERCEAGCTIIMVTHDQSIAARCHQNLDLTPVRNRRS
jgi:putative ABC transport system ATP-binding protein